MIVGICGTSVLGREEVASLLISKGFAYYSIKNEIDFVLRGNGLSVSVMNVRKTDMRMIEKHGKDYWVRRIGEKISEEQLIIDGIRLVEEVKYLRRRKDFCLIGVYSPLEVKFDREVAKSLLSDDDKDNDIYALELEELSAVFKMIDISVVYPSAQNTIKRKVDEALKKAQKR